MRFFLLSFIAHRTYKGLGTTVVIRIINPSTKFNKNLFNIMQCLVCTVQNVLYFQQNVCTAKSFCFKDLRSIAYRISFHVLVVLE